MLVSHLLLILPLKRLYILSYSFILSILNFIFQAQKHLIITHGNNNPLVLELNSKIKEIYDDVKQLKTNNY
jgi:hypothetical protein